MGEIVRLPWVKAKKLKPNLTSKLIIDYAKAIGTPIEPRLVPEGGKANGKANNARRVKKLA
jgi:hypothetical protein